MILLYTDFSLRDPYVGQMHAVIAHRAPSEPIIDLMHGVPNFNIRSGAYLLAALIANLPSRAIILGVVDPGVGGRRRPLMIQADGRWLVGPDNGLFNVALMRASSVTAYVIDWRPKTLSDSFHGRDLFAPSAAMLATGVVPESTSVKLASPSVDLWPDALWEVIYVDHYGNIVTGIPGSGLKDDVEIAVKQRRVRYARTFCEAPKPEPFWYRNANGLVEIAVNQGSASETLHLKVGDSVMPMFDR